MKDFSLIVAIDLDGAIGNSKTNDIPWYLPSDLAFFKQQTLGKTIVMGRRTWESLPFKPLKGRRNVVISSARTCIDGVDAQYVSLAEALEREDNVIIIGGASLYEDCFQFAPKNLYITVVDVESGGDVYFPIEGNILQSYDSFTVLGQSYICVKRGPLQVENNLHFQFTEWTLK